MKSTQYIDLAHEMREKARITLQAKIDSESVWFQNLLRQVEEWASKGYFEYKFIKAYAELDGEHRAIFERFWQERGFKTEINTETDGTVWLLIRWD